MVVNPKHEAHIPAIVTRSGKTLGKDVVDLSEDPGEKASSKKENAKRKRVDQPNDGPPKLNEEINETPKMVEDNSNNPRRDEPQSVPLPQIKILPPFPQRLKKKNDDTKLKKFLKNLVT